MRVHPVIALDYGVAVSEVASVAVALGVGGGAVGLDVEVARIGQANGASGILEVAAPVIAFGIQRRSVGHDVMPAIGGVDGGAAFVESERPQVAGGVGGASVRRYVVRAARVSDGRESGRVEFLDFQEARAVGGASAKDVVR